MIKHDVGNMSHIDHIINKISSSPSPGEETETTILKKPAPHLAKKSEQQLHSNCGGACHLSTIRGRSINGLLESVSEPITSAPANL